MGANRGNKGSDGNANGGGELPWWRVTGELAGVAVTRRYRALTKDEARKLANDHGVRVDTCELI